MSELDAEKLAGRLTDRAPAGIADQIGQLIEAKVLPVDSRLPTVRDLAQELGVSVGTIAQAWSHLREQGLVETRRRGGTRVLPRARRRAEDFAGPGAPLKRLGIMSFGVSAADPASALEATLRIIAHAEDLGVDTAVLSSADGEHGISSPVAVLAAATQRTVRIGLGTTNRVPIGQGETGLSVDLATVDLLSGGRLIGMDQQVHLLRTAIPTDTASREQEARYREVAAALPEHALIGTSDEIADALLADPDYVGAEEATFVLPRSLDEADCTQILNDVSTRLGPALGWSPSPH
ncbi:LLM class flavin-dependent oxidoreductase [Nesterenkonia haasae]|uniref:LLM class flavin-dependent oxidoreductase n=1 Tax=Nesterenkonia haasae TaxID=2587813 RepID=UPI0013914433|nr:LLM class flavin-dependent oxidoreductase [Nesterenkonia haasae]NDK32953.1 LLM class flavin-dependent oxidoreductase [Nesterenkonia haasae]